MFPNWQVGILDEGSWNCVVDTRWDDGSSTPHILVSSSPSLVLMLPWCQCHRLTGVITLITGPDQGTFPSHCCDIVENALSPKLSRR